MPLRDAPEAEERDGSRGEESVSCFDRQTDRQTEEEEEEEEAVMEEWARWETQRKGRTWEPFVDE